MKLTEKQEAEFRAVAVAFEMRADNIALTRDTLENFRTAQGEPLDVGQGFYFWKTTKSPKGKLLVKDMDEFRAAFFQK